MTLPTGRPEDAVECFVCGKPPGESCEAPMSHPLRRKLHEAREAESLATLFTSYDKMREELTGNPAPVDAIALVFREGRACVCVRFYQSDRWIELMSAPGTSEDGLACGVDLRHPKAIAAAYQASASTEEITNFKKDP